MLGIELINAGMQTSELMLKGAITVNHCYVINDVVEAHCYLSISGELIVSRYVAESITMIAGRFGHVGLCQLRTKLKKTAA